MTEYNLLSFRQGSAIRAGIAVGGQVHAVADLTGVPGDETVIGILGDWDAAERRLEQAASGASGGTALAEATLLAPVQHPASVYCAGNNFWDHAAEMAAAGGQAVDPNLRAPNLLAWHFIRPTASMADPGSAVPIPKGCQKLDWEVELVAVIGRAARHVAVADALDHVAGYTVADDVSARDIFTRPPLSPTLPFYWDWIGQKCNEGSCPVGPWIVPARRIADPQKLRIGLRLNGVDKQDSSTSNMVFSLAEQISHLSGRLTLHPGDMILGGTPAGVGMGRGEFLKSGDQIEAWVEGVGTLRHSIA